MSNTKVIIKENTKVEKIEAFVESSSNPGTFYRVTSVDNKWQCTCPQFKYRGACKHIDAVYIEASQSYDVWRSELQKEMRRGKKTTI
jgi:uncharacterized Zn finger protein